MILVGALVGRRRRRKNVLMMGMMGMKVYPVERIERGGVVGLLNRC